MEQKVREERFQAAVAWVRELPSAGAGDGARVSNQTRLDFYALFKQSQKGDASAGEAPGWTSGPVARAKYNAWAGLKGTPREAAKARYVELLEGLDPAFSASQPAPAAAPAQPAAAPAAAPGGPSHPLSPQPSTATARGVVPGASTSGRLPAFDASPSLASYLPSPPPPTVESLGLAAARSEAPAGGAGDASPAALTVQELQQLRLRMKATDLRMDSLESELSSMKTELTVLKHKAKAAEAFGVPLTVGIFMVAWPIFVYRYYLPKAS